MTHPRRRAADQVRQMLAAGGVLPPRDEELARTEQWLASAAGLHRRPRAPPARARLRDLARHAPAARRAAGSGRRPRTYTAHARNTIKAAARFLGWLGERGTTLPGCRQADAEDWLAAGPSAVYIRDFLTWAAHRGHCQPLDIPGPVRHSGTAIADSQRWDLAARMLHDGSIEVTDRVAGCLVLLYGQT